MPESYKTGLIKSLLFQCFGLCPGFINFYHEVDKLKKILYKNCYPSNTNDKSVKLDKLLTAETIVSTVTAFKGLDTWILYGNAALCE